MFHFGWGCWTATTCAVYYYTHVLLLLHPSQGGSEADTKRLLTATTPLLFLLQLPSLSGFPALTRLELSYNEVCVR